MYCTIDSVRSRVNDEGICTYASSVCMNMAATNVTCIQFVLALRGMGYGGNSMNVHWLVLLAHARTHKLIRHCNLY
jgi:hypothetical protein